MNVAKLYNLLKEAEANKTALLKMEVTSKLLRQAVGYATSVKCNKGLLPHRFDAQEQAVSTRGVIDAE